MRKRDTQRRRVGFAAAGAVMVGLALLLGGSIHSASQRPPLYPWEFSLAADQGFGDRQNSWAWCMEWWDGRLYVGTNRAMRCVEAASVASHYPASPYPPADPDIECTDAWEDLPLQAEIWRYTPETATWDRVFQSPQDVPIPDQPDKFVARDIGLRGMAVFTDTEGTEALYVSGVSPRTLYEIPGEDPHRVPPPRLLYTTDGTTFVPIPQDAGTFMGDLSRIDEVAINSFRSLAVYNGRLYLVAGRMQGQGVLLESANPAEGNNAWRVVSLPGQRAWELEPFNGYLYVALDYKGTEDRSMIAKTDGSGDPPYAFTTVLTADDIGVSRALYRTIVSMHVFQGGLYGGTDRPCDLVRINPDDTWELIVGDPREIGGQTVKPLSGLGSGFGWWLNGHFWRIADQEGRLYVGTMDQSTEWKDVGRLREQLEPYMGFDLYSSPDGVHFSMITETGFGHKFDYGARTLVATPFGLFLGTANEYYGLNIFRGVAGVVHNAYLPLVMRASGSNSGQFQESGVSSWVQRGQGHSIFFLEPPEQLQVESQGGAVVLSWEAPRRAVRFHIFRRTFAPYRGLEVSDLDSELWIPGPFVEVGTTDQPFFADRSVLLDRQHYHYYVLAEDSAGIASRPSNLVRAPSLAPAVTFHGLQRTITDWADGGQVTSQNGVSRISRFLADARRDVERGELQSARERLEQCRQRVRRDQPVLLESWRARDLELLLEKLMRRVHLAEAGFISSSQLVGR